MHYEGRVVVASKLHVGSTRETKWDYGTITTTSKKCAAIKKLLNIMHSGD